MVISRKYGPYREKKAMKEGKKNKEKIKTLSELKDSHS